MELDLIDLDLHTADPWPVYRWLRDEAPAYWDATNEIWAVSRYDDILFVSRDPDVFTSTQGNRPHLPPDPSMINQDGEQHTRQRGLVSKGFTPRRIAALEDHVRSIVRGLLEQFPADGHVDVVTALAKPLPMRVIGEMLGYPAEDDAKLLSWVDAFVNGGSGPRYVTDAVNEAFGHFAMYHQQVVAERTANPGDDLMSVWLGAEIDGHKLSEMQLLFEHVLLLVGGSETTRNVIAGGLLALAQHPEQYTWLRANPAGIPRAAEELIRWVTPFVNMCRTATRDVELHGRVMKEGQQVMMLYPSANRDPRAFDAPDVFDVKRETDRHAIAFGYGRHFCLGSNLARLEIRVVLEEVLRHFAALGVDPERQPEALRSAFIRGHHHVPLLISRA